MRFCYLVLLSAAFFLANTNAASEQSTTTKTALLDTAQFDQSLITGGNEISSKRFLRTNDISDGDAEERTIDVAAASKLFGSKLKRLAKYNKWIFSNVKPEDIRLSHPKYYESYFKFYANRMIPGGKYA